MTAAWRRAPAAQRQRGDAGGRAAQLERARPLQVLELQPDVGAGAPAERRRRDQRRHAGQPADALRDLAARDLAPDFGIEHPLHRADLAANVPSSVVEIGHVVRVARPAGQGRPRRRRRTPRASSSCGTRSAGSSARSTPSSRRTTTRCPRCRRSPTPSVTASSWRCARATSTRDLVVFCGVRFMAEGCHTLAPERPVYLPNLRGALLAGRGRRRRRRRAAGVPARGRAAASRR